MRAVRTTVFLGLALLALPSMASQAQAQVRVFTPFIGRSFFTPGFSSWYYPNYYSTPGYSYPGYGYGGYPGYGYPGYGYGGYPSYGYGYPAAYAPYRYTYLTTAYAATTGTAIPPATYSRAAYLSPTPYSEPSFVRPAGYANTYYSSSVGAYGPGTVRAAGYSDGSGTVRPANYPDVPRYPSYYHGPYCP